MKHITALIFAVNAALVVPLGWGLAKYQASLLKKRIPATYQKLRPDSWLLVISLSSLWMALVFLLSLILSRMGVRPVSENNEMQQGIFGVVFLLLSARILQAYFALLGISPEGVAWWTLGRGRKDALETPWKDVAQVDASALSSRFSLRARSGAAYGNYFMGRQTLALIEAFSQHLPEKSFTKKAKAIFEKKLQWLRCYPPARK